MANTVYPVEMPAPARQAGTMKVTTVRFGDDLWRLLELEAELVGVSVSQYIREAALARAAAAAAARGTAPFELLAAGTRDAFHAHPDPARRHEVEDALSTLASVAATEVQSDARAVRGESRQALRKSAKARAQAETEKRRSTTRRR